LAGELTEHQRHIPALQLARVEPPKADIAASTSRSPPTGSLCGPSGQIADEFDSAERIPSGAAWPRTYLR
jgi:hypothetical protein